METNITRFLAVGLAVLLLFHGVDKIVNGVGDIQNMLEKLSIPYAKYLAHGVYIGEVIAPLLLIFNHYIRIALALIIVNMISAIFFTHRTTLFTVNNHGAWSIEVPLLYLIISITLFFLYKPKQQFKRLNYL
jgi:putative oxidoreductase